MAHSHGITRLRSTRATIDRTSRQRRLSCRRRARSTAKRWGVLQLGEVGVVAAAVGISSVERELSSESVSVQVRVGVGSIERLDGAMDGKPESWIAIKVKASGASSPGGTVL